MYYILRDFSLRNKFALLGAVYCSVFTVFGLAGFHKAHDDHVSMMQIILERDMVADSYFLIPVYFYSIFDIVGFGAENAAKVLGVVACYLTLRHVDRLKDFWVCLFFLSPAPMLYLSMPSKEIFIIYSLIFFCSLLDSKRYFYSIFVMASYALLFRVYVLFFVAGVFLRYVPFFLLLTGLSVGSVGVLFYFDTILFEVTDVLYRRDVFYDMHSDIVRSAWFNPYDLDSVWGVVSNYAYSFSRLNFPVYYSLTAKEVYLQIYVVLVVLCIVLSLKKSFYIGLGMLFMWLVYPIFELDLGSYLRHVSSWFPLYVWTYLRFLRNKEIDGVFS